MANCDRCVRGEENERLKVQQGGRGKKLLWRKAANNGAGPQACFVSRARICDDFAGSGTGLGRWCMLGKPHTHTHRRATTNERLRECAAREFAAKTHCGGGTCGSFALGWYEVGRRRISLSLSLATVIFQCTKETTPTNFSQPLQPPRFGQQRPLLQSFGTKHNHTTLHNIRNSCAPLGWPRLPILSSDTE